MRKRERERGEREREGEGEKEREREREKLVETRLFLSDFIADQKKYIKMKSREKE